MAGVPIRRAAAQPGLFDSPALPEVRIGGVTAAFVERSGADEPLAADVSREDEAIPAKTKPGKSAPRKAALRAEPALESTVADTDERVREPEPPTSNGDSPEAPRPRRRGATAEQMAAKQRDISVSEFFAKNRHLLGFDNKRKALLTTVKEAVDNSLDACEEAGLLPDLHILIDQLAEDRFRITVRDNGPGIVKAQIPNIFGKLLYGSKFHRLKMSRGQQGIGISAAGMYGLLTTGKPVHITSRTGAKKPAHHFQIAIDTTKNRPDIVHDDEVEVEWERGTEVTIELVASYAKGRQSVDEYIEQTAIANPHAMLFYKAPTGEHREFPRGTQELPAETREIQPHPHGIELGVLMKMLKEAGTKARRHEGTEGDGAAARTLSGFLQNSFSRVSSKVAHDMCGTAKLKPNAKPADLSPQEAEQLFQAMQTAKVQAPPTDCLAPIGVRNMLAGICKEVKAEFYTATTRKPAVYRGNPFQIEIALAYGGQLSAEEAARIIRFANRVPLLYQQSACLAYKSVLDVDWRNYNISQPGGAGPVGPLVVLVHMASVWVPFTSESKEAIADYDEIRKEIKLAIMECGRKLGSYLRRRRRQRLEADKRGIFERYIPDVAEALNKLTGVSEKRLLDELQRLAKARTATADVEFDEDGNPIARADEPDEITADDGTVIVEANAVPPPAEDLFEADAPPPRPRRKRAT
jgi:DNA topoisomerase-6 subunit B